MFNVINATSRTVNKPFEHHEKKNCRKVNFETRYSKACIVKLLKVRRNYSYALSSLQTVVILLLLENAVIGRWNIAMHF